MALNINGTTGISGVDGSASAASIAGTDANTGLSFASDTVNINTGGITRATVDSSGNLGIGESSPANLLHVKVSDTGVAPHGSAQIVLERSGTNYLQFLTASTGTSGILFGDGNDADVAQIKYDHNATSMQFITETQERMRLRTSTGALMIGDTGSTRIGEPQLHIRAQGASNNCASFLYNTVDDRAALIVKHVRASGSTFAPMMVFIDSGGNTVGAINSNGNNTTNFATSSDYRLKENNVPISDGIIRLKTLKPYRFNWKVDPTTTVDGFFAHEVTAVPEAVTGTKDETEDVLYRDDDEIPSGKSIGDVKETVPKYQGIDQSKLVPLLTAALQEAVAKIEVLETKVAALEAA